MHFQSHGHDTVMVMSVTIGMFGTVGMSAYTIHALSVPAQQIVNFK